LSLSSQIRLPWVMTFGDGLLDDGSAGSQNSRLRFELSAIGFSSPWPTAVVAFA